jgi:hypothetical protein
VVPKEPRESCRLRLDSFAGRLGSGASSKAGRVHACMLRSLPGRPVPYVRTKCGVTLASYAVATSIYMGRARPRSASIYLNARSPRQPIYGKQVIHASFHFEENNQSRAPSFVQAFGFAEPDLHIAFSSSVTQLRHRKIHATSSLAKPISL